MISWTAFLVGLRVHILEIFAYVAKELNVLNFVPRVHLKTLEILSFQCGAKVGYATYYPSIPGRQVHPGYFNFVTLILLWKRFHLHKLIEPGKYGTNGREKSIRKLLSALETFEFSMRYLIGSLSIRLILQLKTSNARNTHMPFEATLFGKRNF